MTLTVSLKNFRVFDEPREIHFPGPGSFLLQAPNGHGKSSTLEAILFALYGSGKESVSTDFITFGEKTCRVTLEFNGRKIIRDNGRNKVKVLSGSDEDKNECSGEVAQEVINSQFGTDFMITSYITQDVRRTFFGLTATEKMEFLENLAIGKVGI